MSLHDRYYRGDSRLQRIDRRMTELGDNLGEGWAAVTGANRTMLTQGLFVFAAWAGMQHLLLFQSVTMTIIVVAALLSFMGLQQSRGGLVEQIQAEGLGLPPNAFALARVVTLVAGLLPLTVAFGGILAAWQAGTSLTADIQDSLLAGAAITALQLSDYIRRTNPATPSGGRGTA